ncbi:MAG: dephospho-CoA kinase [Actinobacteria bacterium]|nr:dephospho-CoA kinase [Actinomycetota bacterium]NBO34316.1 dephospho-CoA kinase [Actinomycetota bacterium]
MYLGLSGGIGSGKSTVAKILSDLGAVVIDADAIAKEVLEPGQVGYESVVHAFGGSVLDTSGNIDRKQLAAAVFQDTSQLAQLEAIVHPAVSARVTQIRESLPANSIVVYDTPLLVEKQLQDQFDKVIIVIADVDVRRSRLVSRGLDTSDIAARIANQVTDEQRMAVADFVVTNNGSLQELREHVTQVWHQLTA